MNLREYFAYIDRKMTAQIDALEALPHSQEEARRQRLLLSSLRARDGALVKTRQPQTAPPNILRTGEATPRRAALPWPRSG